MNLEKHVPNYREQRAAGCLAVAVVSKVTARRFPEGVSSKVENESTTHLGGWSVSCPQSITGTIAELRMFTSQQCVNSDRRGPRLA